MHDLRPADHAELGRVAQIGTGDRGRRIAERIGPVALRLIGKPDQMRLYFQTLTVRLAAEIEQARRRTIGVRMRIALRQHVALAVQETERFIARLMIDNDKLTEVRAVRHIDDGFPAALHLLRRKRAEETRAARLDHERSQKAQRVLIPAGMAVEGAAAFLQIDRDVPFELTGLA